MRTQTRSHPGASGIYRAGLVNRRPLDLSNSLDNAFVQQKVSMNDFSAVLLSSPDRRIPYNGCGRPFFESVGCISFHEVRWRARPCLESGTSHENSMRIERYKLGT